MLTLTNCIITAYCIASSSHNRCADGKHFPLPQHTIAIGDRSTIPLGAVVMWKGQRFVGEDRMNKRFDGTHRFDVFVSSKKEARKFGIKRNQTIIIGE